MSLYDKYAAVAAKASELIDHTPPGYVTIGGQFADLAPHMGRYDRMPDGKSFDTAVTGVGTAMSAVSVNGAASTPATVSGVAITPNKDFAGVDQIVPDFDEWKWRGEAADNFKKNYQALTPYVADAQFVATSVLGAAMEAQGELYDAVYANLGEIADKTLGALEASDGRGDADWSFSMAVLVAVGTVAITVASGGGDLPVLLSVATGGANIAGALPLLKASAGDPQDVMTHMYSAINTVESHMRSRETQIGQGLTDMADAISAEVGTTYGPDAYPLFRYKPTGFAGDPGTIDSYDGS